MPTADPATPVKSAGSVSRRAALWTLAVFTAINLLNYLDRFVISPLLPVLKQEMDLSDTQLGLLVPAFILVYMLAAPFFGAWATAARAPMPSRSGVGLWSIATLLSGLAHGYWHLLAARALVGIGEAAFVAIAAAMLADLFPAGDRARVYAVLNMAIPVGSALGYVLGGLVGHHFGWRAAFFVAGAPGIVLAFAVLLLKDPPRGSAGSRRPRPAPRPGHGPVTVYLQACCGAAVHAGGARLRRPTPSPWAGWPSGCPPSWSACAGFRSSKAAVTSGRSWSSPASSAPSPAAGCRTTCCATPARRTCGSPAWSPCWRLPARTWRSRLQHPGSTPPALVAAELLLFMSTGPINAAIVNVVSPLERASAVALSMFMIHLLGDVPSPL